MHSVLIIWHEPGDDLTIYLIAMEDAEFEKWAPCHGHYLGLSKTPASLDDLMLALYDGLKIHTPIHHDDKGVIMPQMIAVDRIIITGQIP